jgi:hypothetical protein
VNFFEKNLFFGLFANSGCSFNNASFLSLAASASSAV